MHKTFALTLALATLPVMAAQEEEGSEYKGWCNRSAIHEKIPASEREDFIQECVASLVEADRNPKSKRKRDSDEE